MESRESVSKFHRFRWIVVVLIVFLILSSVGIYAWLNLYNPCDVNAVKEASTYLSTRLKSYDDLAQVATTATRTSLDYPVNGLKQIFLDTRELDVPVCMQSTRQELTTYMEIVIQAFLAYRDGKPDATIRELLAQSDIHYENFHTELEVVNKCAPFCIR